MSLLDSNNLKVTVSNRPDLVVVVTEGDLEEEEMDRGEDLSEEVEVTVEVVETEEEGVLEVDVDEVSSLSFLAFRSQDHDSNSCLVSGKGGAAASPAAGATAPSA